MPEVVSVALVYPNDKRDIFQVCAEFLRFMGLYVSEYCKLPQDTEEGHYNTENVTEAYVDLTDYPVFDVNSVNDQYRILNMLYDELKGYNFQGDFLGTFPLLEATFITNNLLQAAVTLQCFRVDDALVLDAGECFKNAAETLKGKIENYLFPADLCYLYYAKLYSQQKANLSRYLCEKSMVFSVNEIAKECLKIIKSNPQFSNAKVLLGLIYENVSTKIRAAVDAYEDALLEIGEQCYASSVYYWLGKRCENTSTYGERCKEAYREAHRAAYKYRNIFKMAMICKWEEDIAGELRYLEDCVKYIERKGSYLDPLEHEYFFKTNVLIGYIYIYNDELKNIPKGISHIQDALKLRDYIQNEKNGVKKYTKYYQDVYGTKANDYIDLALRRMNVKKAYEYLAKAFTLAGMHNIADKYSKLIEK